MKVKLDIVNHKQLTLLWCLFFWILVRIGMELQGMHTSFSHSTHFSGDITIIEFTAYHPPDVLSMLRLLNTFPKLQLTM